MLHLSLDETPPLQFISIYPCIIITFVFPKSISAHYHGHEKCTSDHGHSHSDHDKEEACTGGHEHSHSHKKEEDSGCSGDDGHHHGASLNYVFIFFIYTNDDLITADVISDPSIVLLFSLPIQSTSTSTSTSMNMSTSINTSTSMNMSMLMITRRRKISPLGRRRPWRAAVMTPWQLPSADPGTWSLRLMLPRANKYNDQVLVVA